MAEDKHIRGMAYEGGGDCEKGLGEQGECCCRRYLASERVQRYDNNITVDVHK